MKTILSGIQTWVKGKIKQSTADWNQNDKNADSYVKNRTHWEEKKQSVIIDNLTSEQYDNGDYPACTFVVGQEYTVIWNGVIYNNLICQFDGNYRILGGNVHPNCPFYIDDNGGNGLYVSSWDEVEDFTVSIIEHSNIIHKLDPKYLPEDIGAQADWNQNSSEAKDYVKNRTHYDDKESGIILERSLVFENGETDYHEYHDNLPIIRNMNYILSINGVEYDVEPYYDDTDSQYCLDAETESAYISVYERYLYIGGKWDNNTGDQLPLSEKYEIIVYDPREMYKRLDACYLPKSIVRNDVDQRFTDEEKSQARENINAVTYDELQSNVIWYGTFGTNNSIKQYEYRSVINLDNEGAIKFKYQAGEILIIRELPESETPATATGYSSFELLYNNKNKQIKNIDGSIMTRKDIHDLIKEYSKDEKRFLGFVFMYDGTYWQLLPSSLCVDENEFDDTDSNLKYKFPTAYSVKKYLSQATEDFATVNDLSNYYNKSEIDAIMGSYINDIDTLLGGDA